MKLVDGVHHVTFLTNDLDWLVAFYERIFAAEQTLDMTRGGHAPRLHQGAPTTVLHPFQPLEGPPPPESGPILGR